MRQPIDTKLRMEAEDAASRVVMKVKSMYSIP